MSTCGSCTPCSPTDSTCVTVAPVLAPCPCPDTPAVREEGPPGAQGAVGDIPAFTVGTVTEGAADVIFTENTPVDYTVDFVIPQPPTDTANTWTAVQTFEQTPVFEAGINVTGGITSIGGTGMEVAPDATFENSVLIDGNLTVDTIVAEGNVGIDGDLSVAGNATLIHVGISGDVSFGAASTLVLPTVTGFIRGLVVIDSCNKPHLVPNRGSDLYTKADATGLVTITTLTSDQLCDPIQVNVPVSGCTPQITPIVNIMVRIGYSFPASAPGGNFQINLRQGSIVGTVLDAFIQGEALFDNTPAGCAVLEGQATLAVGLNSFYIEVTNNTDQDFTPNQVVSWITN